MMSTFLFILSLLYFEYISYCAGAACANLKTEHDCLLSPSCEWNEQASQQCYCSSNAPLDVVFFLDESGSVGSSNFDLEQAFVADMIRQGLSDQSNVHVAKFSSRIRKGYNFWWDQSDKQYIANYVEALSYRGGQTRMDLALEYLYYDVFPTWKKDADYKGYKTLLIFITDGEPYPSGTADPCPYVARLQEIIPDVIVIGISSGFSAKKVECMVTPNYAAGNRVANSDRIIEITNWTPSLFADAQILTESFLCPDQFSLKLTEIRMEEYVNGGTTHQSRFVEFWNDGEDLDLTKGNLKFSGLLNSGSSGFGLGGLSTCNLIISKGQYIVIYDPAMDTPTCPQCNCTLSGSAPDEKCNESLYIPCNGIASTSGCGTCSWDTNMDNDEWDQEVSDFATPDVILSKGNRIQSDTLWVNVYQGYSTELKDTSLDPEKATSWKMSCDYPGTPGAPPLSPCTIKCIPDICKSQGDGDASCNTGYDECVCTNTETKHYYSSPNGYCLALYPPISCHVTNVFDQERQQILAQVEWSIAGINYEGLVYFKVYHAKETSTSYGLNSYKGYSIRGDEEVYIRAAYLDPVNGEVLSNKTYCDIETVAPTKEPTPSPTESNADIADCTATVVGYNEVQVSWSDGYKGETTDIDEPYTYFIYGWWDESKKPNTYFDRSTPVTDETFYLKQSQTLDFSNGGPEIYVVTVIINEETGGIDYDRMKADGQGKKQCDIKTNAPTKVPTQNPSKSPTKTPSKAPTKNPTLRPTYSPWTIEGCTVKIAGSNEADANIVDVTFDYIKPEETSDKYTVKFIVNDIEKGTTGGTTDEFPLSVDLSEINLAIKNNKFEARIEYEEYPGSSVETDKIKCKFITKEPTTSPTMDPTKSPTTDPTKNPTKTPSKSPTKTPTKSPTFKKLPLSTCTVTINSDLTYLSIIFDETIFDDDDPNKIYPPSTDIFYKITVGPTRTDKTEEYKVAADRPQESKEYIINDFNKNEFDVDFTKINIGVVDRENNDIGTIPIQCNLLTQRPTKAPTTPSPTSYPTTEAPEVRLDLIEKDEEGNIKIKDWGFDAESGINCIFPAGTIRRLQDETETTSVPAELVNPCPNCPICTVKDNEDVKYIRIVRTPSYFAYDILVYLEILFLKDTDGEGISTKDFDYKSIDKKWHQLFAKTGPVKGSDTRSILGGSSNNRIDIEYYLDQENANKDREVLEYFLVRIVRCSVDNSTGAVTPLPSQLNNIYNKCYRGAYPEVIIAIEQKPEDGSFTTTTLGDLPMWVWAPIGFAAVAIPIVAYLIWRFYNAKKIADAMEIQRKHELGEAEKQDDVGEFGIVGDNIHSNPLATGDAFEIPKGDVIIDHHLKLDKMNFEVATTDVERNIFKQDFGPVQAEKHHK